jgi:hypothetical protein
LPSCCSANEIAAATAWVGAWTAGTPPAACTQPAAVLAAGSCADATEKLPPAYWPAYISTLCTYDCRWL